MRMGTFELLSKTLQRKVWDMKWESFTYIQDRAIPAVLMTDNDIVLSAGTASGKTEAALLPILTAVEDSARTDLKVIYVSPLKALINNQFERIEQLCDEMDIAINRWHGDVSVSKKRSFVKNPSGVLQITPESIESFFINYPGSLETIFSQVEFIVVDEVHSFVDSGRGVHLRSLLSRIQAISLCTPRFVCLSATTSNFDVVKRWINYLNPDGVDVIEDENSDKLLLYSLMCFEASDRMKPAQLFEDIRSLTTSRKAIVFCNSRGDVEEATVMLNRLAKRDGFGQVYYPHHSSIDKKEREYVERVMMETMEPKSVVATSSLEMGIDIGNIDLVIQVDNTFTVSSLKQRLGRSGRKRSASQILQLYATSGDSLLQSLAVMELILDGWVEPAEGYPIPYDIAVQQILSICAQKNGVIDSELIESLLKNHVFYVLDLIKLKQLIDYLIDEDMLERLSGSGELIVGISGERVLRSREFYSVFMTPEEYDVVEGSKNIGKIGKTPFVFEGDNVILAGMLWTIVMLDKDQNKCYVKRAVNGRPPKYNGDGGKIHKRIGEKMMEILCSDDSFEYVDVNASQLLERCRIGYRVNGVKCDERVLWKSSDEYVFETFTSSKIATTLYWMMHVFGVDVQSRDSIGRIVFRYDGDVEVLYDELRNRDWDVGQILSAKKEKQEFVSKYAFYLPMELRDEVHIEHELDLRGAVSFLNGTKWRICLAG